MSTYYENQLIGQFLFELGHFVGSTKQKTAGTINLFQQNPLDPALADLLLGADSRFFLLEFKKEGNIRSEFKKEGIRAYILNKLKIANTVKVSKLLSAAGYSHWNEVSPRCHYICNSNGTSSSFMPYIEALYPNGLTPYGIKYATYSSYHKFIATGIYGTPPAAPTQLDTRAGLPRDQFKAYLKWLFQGAPAKKTTDEVVFFCFAVNEDTLVWTCGSTIKQFFTNPFSRDILSVPKTK